MHNLLLRHVSRNQERCTLSPGNPASSEQTAQVLLAMPNHSLEAACPTRTWRDVLSNTTGMLRAPPLQQPRKNSGEDEWNIQPGDLIPFSPKIKSWTVTSYILLHPQELFSEVKKSKMGNLWSYNCLPCTVTHGSLEKSYRPKLRETRVHGTYY